MSQDINDDKGTTDASLSGAENLITKTKLEDTALDSTLKKEVKEKKSFIERWKNSRLWLVKGSYYLLHYTWVVVMAIGAFIAWLIAMLMV